MTARLSLLLALGLSSLPVLAAGTQPPDPHAEASERATAGRLDRQLAQSQSKVEKLQQGVAQQESVSRQSAARLQRQDQTIADLQRQLQALEPASGAAPSGH